MVLGEAISITILHVSGMHIGVSKCFGTPNLDGIAGSLPLSTLSRVIRRHFEAKLDTSTQLVCSVLALDLGTEIIILLIQGASTWQACNRCNRKTSLRTFS